jgi:hypothetical protein
MTSTDSDETDKSKLPEGVKTILNELKKSPAFAMSRGGRELFHTNFLAFILEEATVKGNEETYTQHVKKALLAKFFGGSNIPTNVLVFREKSNLDLIIVPIDHLPALSEENEIGKDGQVSTDSVDLTICIVEAKLKSIPTKNQLISYSKKLDATITIDLNDDNDSKLQIKKPTKNNNERKVIIKNSLGDEKVYGFKTIEYKCLLLAPESFLIDKVEEFKWSNLNWKCLLCDIDELNIECKREDENHLLNTFVSDYVTSTRLVIDLIKKVTETVDKFVDNNEINLDALHKFTIDSFFKKLKLHDLVGKVAYEYLAKKIHQTIPKSSNEIVSYQAFMTNSTPGFQIEYSKLDDKKQCGFGVQLQGTDYRHFVRRSYIDDGSQLAECLDTKIKNWMASDGNKGPKSNSDDFKKFNINKFLYKSRTAEKYSFEDLHSALMKSLNVDSYDDWLNNISSTKP